MKKLFASKKFTVLIIAAAAAVFFTIYYNVSNNEYWSKPHLTEITLKLLSQQNEIEPFNETPKNSEAVNTANKNAVPVREEAAEFIAGCNDLIIKYFNDNYNIDVSKRLSDLNIMESVYPDSVSEEVGGSYNKEKPDKLFINKAVIDNYIAHLNGGEASNSDFEAKMLRTVYIHEVMHYLGFNSQIGFNYFTEALAEALNKEITEYNNIPYESITGYADIQKYAEALIKCDSDFVKNVLCDKEFNAADYFISQLNGAADVDYALMLDDFIHAIRTGSGSDTDKTKYYTKFLITEYCKNINEDARTILESVQNSEIFLFGLKRALGIY